MPSRHPDLDGLPRPEEALPLCREGSLVSGRCTLWSTWERLLVLAGFILQASDFCPTRPPPMAMISLGLVLSLPNPLNIRGLWHLCGRLPHSMWSALYVFL